MEWQLPENGEGDNRVLQILHLMAPGYVKPDGFQKCSIRHSHHRDCQPHPDALQVGQAMAVAGVSTDVRDKQAVICCNFEQHKPYGDGAKGCRWEQVVFTDASLHGVALCNGPCLCLRYHHVEKHGAHCNWHASKNPLHFFHLCHCA